MKELRDTRIEIAGEGDIELLDYALTDLGFGAVERNFRLFNIRSREHFQLVYGRKGKTRIWQPFRASFARNTAGNYVVTTTSRRPLAQAVIEQAGFTVLDVQKGDFPEIELGGGVMTFGCHLNGRQLSVHIDCATLK